MRSVPPLTANKEVIATDTSTVLYQKGGGEAEGHNFIITIHKEDETKQALAGAEFEITRAKTGQVVGTIVTNSDGNESVGKLLRESYTIKETKAPEGYELSTKEIKISSDDFGTNKAVLKTVINKKKEEPKINISGTKTWNDANNQDDKRPNSIQVQLLADGKKQGDVVELNAANNWTITWNDLAQKVNGQDIVYTIEEFAVPGYITTVDDTDKGNILLTNTYTPTTLNKPKTPTKPETPSTPGKHLPKTGEQKTMWLTLSGLILLSVISVYIFCQNKGVRT